MITQHTTIHVDDAKPVLFGVRDSSDVTCPNFATIKVTQSDHFDSALPVSCFLFGSLSDLREWAYQLEMALNEAEHLLQEQAVAGMATAGVAVGGTCDASRLAVVGEAL